MSQRILLFLLALHPHRFRQMMGQAILEDFSEFERHSRRRAWGVLLDLVRNLPGVYLDQFRLDRARPRGYRARQEAPMLELLSRDLRFAVRRLLRTPAMTAAAVLTLALGIGGTTAIFSLINGVFLNPLSAPEPDRIVDLYEMTAEGQRMALSYETFLDYQRDTSSLEALAVFRSQSVNVTGGDEAPERIRGLFVTASFFEVLGESPVLGRALRVGEDLPGGEYAAVLSHGFWQRRFGGDRAVIGRSVDLNNIEHTIVGVMGPDFRFPYDRTEAWISLQTFPGELNRANRTFPAIGRLAAGATLTQAQGELATLATGLAESHPISHENVSAGARPLVEIFAGSRTQDLFRILLTAVATILLIGTANVANLQLAQATGRAREMAVRTAVGASRGRLVGQLLIENLLLAVMGGAVGIGVAYGSIHLLSEFGPGWIGGLFSIEPDLRVLGFTLILSLVTGLAFGLIPARRAARSDLVEGLKDGGRGAGPSQKSGRLRSALVVAQTTLAVMLVICAGLLARSFANLQQVDVGFDTAGLMTVQFRLPANKYDEDEKVIAFFDQLIERVEALPGVETAATAVDMPFTGDGGRAQILADGIEPGTEVEVPAPRINIVSANYFESMGIPLLRGRTFRKGDRGDALPVAVLSEEAATAIWPNGEEPLGRTFRFRGDETDVTVIGVASDIHNRGLRDGVDPMLYMVQTQEITRFATLAARVQGDPYEYGPILRQAIWDIDPNQPVWELVSQDDRIGSWVGSDRFASSLLNVFAGTALLLAAIGIGGVIAYAVALRRRELGIRISLGASQRRIIRLVMGQGLKLVVFGLALGLIGAVALRHLLDSFLFGVEAFDLLSFAMAPLLLLAIAVIATLLPALRAAGLDPISTLREE